MCGEDPVVADSGFSRLVKRMRGQIELVWLISTVGKRDDSTMLSDVSVNPHAERIVLTWLASGLTCSGNNWCRGQPPPSDVPVWSVFTDKWGMEGFLTTSRIDSLSVLAKPIFVAHQSSDQKLLQSAQDEAHGQNTGSNTTAGTTSLSGGAIAGIAIGSAFGGILLATLATFVALRFCFGYRKLRQDAQYDKLNEQEKRRTAGTNARELDSSNHYNELQADPRAELPVPMKELGVETDPGSYRK